MKLEKNQFLNIFSLLERLKNLFSRIGGPAGNPWKNREKSQIGPGRSDKLWKPPQTYFLELRRSLRSKWVIYQPHTTIFDEVVFLRSWGIFGRFPGNRILVDLWICDIAGEKHNILGKLFFREIIFWEMSIRVLGMGNFGFCVKNMIPKVFTTLWNLGSRIFRRYFVRFWNSQML